MEMYREREMGREKMRSERGDSISCLMRISFITFKAWSAEAEVALRLAIQAFTPGYQILIVTSGLSNNPENKVKSHLAWIYAHVGKPVKYKVKRLANLKVRSKKHILG